MAGPRFIIVGGGLAGLSCAIKIAEAGHQVDLFSVVPVKRSHSVCAQGGINAAVNTKGEGDSPEIHFYDTVKGGDFLAHQSLCKGMCYSAPDIIYLMDRMGVPFSRTPEGLLDFRRFGGTLHHRTAFAGATTGQQLLYALDEQVRRYEVDGLVTKYEGWEFLGAILDDDRVCRGIIASQLSSMEIRSFPAEAVILATGGPGLIYGRSTNSMINTGSATAIAYQQGAKYANGEFIQIHPTAIPGEDKLRLMSESARGEGGRIWVPRKKDDARPGREIPENERWYFLEEKYHVFGNLVPRDIASREIHNVVYNLGYSTLPTEKAVYLDLTHKPKEFLDKKLGGIMEIYEKFVGEDPRTEPMRIFPGVHYSMGGLWVDYAKKADGFPDLNSPKNQMTNIAGLYAIGECDYQYHGANRLGANSLLSCIYAGLICGPSAIKYAAGLKGAAKDVPAGFFEREQKKWSGRFASIRKMSGSENPYLIHREMGEMMIANVSIVRFNDKLQETLNKLDEYADRWKRCSVLDESGWNNQNVFFLNHLWNMIELAKVITKGALLRDECRGSHYKPDFDNPQPDDFKPNDYIEYQDLKKKGADEAIQNRWQPRHIEYMEKFKIQNEKWLKTTIAEWSPDGPKISFEDVDTSLIPPRPRKYD